MKMNLAVKVFCIIGITLTVGFSVLGATSLWMIFNSNTRLQTLSAQDNSGIIRESVEELMMGGDSKTVNNFVAQLKAKKTVLDLAVFNNEGKRSGGNAGADPLVLESFKSGKPQHINSKTGGLHTLVSVIPLPNDQRCKSCHDEPGYTGAIILTSSLEEGYKSTLKFGMLITAIGAVCFILIVGGMYLFFKLTIIKNIVTVSNNIHLLSQGEGDLTVVLPITSSDEIGVLTAGVNNLVAKLKGIISDLYVQAGHVATTSCSTTSGLEKLAASILEQKELAASVAVASEEMSATLNDVALTTAKASTHSRQVDESAREGQSVVGETVEVLTRSGSALNRRSG